MASRASAVVALAERNLAARSGLVSATAVIAEKSRAEVVKAHISQIIEAGKKYNADKGTESVDYNTLVSEKYLKPVQPVAGEKYDEISIEAAGGSAKTVTARGTEVSRAY